MFLMPGLVIALYTVGAMDQVLPAPWRREMVRYLRNHQNADGGFGLHIEGHSTMFGTALRCAPRRGAAAATNAGMLRRRMRRARAAQAAWLASLAAQEAPPCARRPCVSHPASSTHTTATSTNHPNARPSPPRPVAM